MPYNEDMKNEFNLVGITNSVRSSDRSFNRGGEFDSVRSYQHEFADVDYDDYSGDDDDEDYSIDDEHNKELITTRSSSPKSSNGNGNGKNGYNNNGGRESETNNPALAFFYRRWKSILLVVTLLCIVLLIGWTFFTAEYEVIRKHKKDSSSSSSNNNKSHRPHRYKYEYEKEEVNSCEKDGCGLSAQADDRHKNVTKVLKNNTEIEKDHCGWGNKKEYMPGDSAIHFEARKNVGKGCTYCRQEKCVYKHPLYGVCLSDSQCMSNKCDKEQLCAEK